MLPGVDGFQVCRQIRKDPALIGINVLAITGYDSAEMKANMMECGAYDYLANPMENSVLMQKVRKLLDINEKEEQNTAQ